MIKKSRTINLSLLIISINFQSIFAIEKFTARRY
jgi:hypothetical protein